jgi:SatD family (SatD)
MSQMKPVATLIGDVVGSRAVGDRGELHGRLTKAVDAANQELSPVTPLRITIGDEFQGTFPTVGAAIHAALWLRVELLPEADLRHGIGWGGVSVLEDAPRVEDGPGWWAARRAIDEVKEMGDRPGLRRVRTRYGRADGRSGPDPDAINAALMCRDQLLAVGDPRTVRLLRGMLAGRSQRDLAAEEGISASAVSQRARNDGLVVLLAADALLQEVA